MFGFIKSFFAGPPPLRPEEMARVKALVDNIIATSPIAIFSKSYCPYCNRAKALLNSQPSRPEIKVVELDHEREGEAMQRALAEREGKGSVTVPQIYIRQKLIGGSDDLMAAQRSGQLDRLLKGA